MKANYKPQKKETTEVAIGSLYEANQLIMKDETPMTDEEIDIIRIKKLYNWILARRPSEKYFMLLCNELKDYTVFNLDKNDLKMQMAHNCAAMSDDVIDCMRNRGILIALEETPDHSAWEIWVKIDGIAHAYHLFPYTTAVLEY